MASLPLAVSTVRRWVSFAVAGAWVVAGTTGGGPAAAAPPAPAGYSAAVNPGVHTDRVVFGQSAKLSGAGGTTTGRQYRDGLLLAFNTANRAGGVAGRRIELTSLDDEISADKAVANTRALIHAHQVFALVGYTFTAPVRAVLPLVRDSGIPFIAPYTGTPELYSDEVPNVFVTRASFSDELQTIVRHIDTVGYDQIGLVIYANPLGEEFRREVEQGLRAKGRAITVHGAMALSSKDPAAASRAAVDRLAVTCPKVIVLGVSGRDAAAVVRGMQASRCGTVRYLARGLVDLSMLRRELGEAARGIMVTQVVPNPYRQAHPLLAAYHEEMNRRATSRTPDFAEFEGFIVGQFVVQALRRCGTALDRSCFIGALEAGGLDGPSPYRLAFGRGKRVGSRYTNIVMISEQGRITD